ncbi:MAG: tail fiber domain-containing protein [Proteobacteria bacterium]|nr:tail fiber domain-containing protein [Pseudomonadota bacterium]
MNFNATAFNFGGQSGGFLTCDTSVRSPIFYDSNNTGYYVDPASTSLLNNVQVNTFGVGTAASGTTGEIRATNNVTAYYSDERLKKNIRPIPSALSKLLSLRGVTFNNNKTAEKYGYIDKKEQVGVIAQEVEKVLPQIVVPAPFDIAQDEDGNEYSKSGENYKTVHYDKLVPLLIEAIKELKGEIEELKSKISV